MWRGLQRCCWRAARPWKKPSWVRAIGHPCPCTLVTVGATPARGTGAAIGVEKAEAQPLAALGSLARLLAVAAKLAFLAGWKKKHGVPSPTIHPCTYCLCVSQSWLGCPKPCYHHLNEMWDTCGWSSPGPETEGTEGGEALGMNTAFQDGDEHGISRHSAQV